MQRALTAPPQIGDEVVGPVHDISVLAIEPQPRRWVQLSKLMSCKHDVVGLDKVWGIEGPATPATLSATIRVPTRSGGHWGVKLRQIGRARVPAHRSWSATDVCTAGAQRVRGRVVFIQAMVATDAGFAGALSCRLPDRAGFGHHAGQGAPGRT